MKIGLLGLYSGKRESVCVKHKKFQDGTGTWVMGGTESKLLQSACNQLVPVPSGQISYIFFSLPLFWPPVTSSTFTLPTLSTSLNHWNTFDFQSLINKQDSDYCSKQGQWRLICGFIIRKCLVSCSTYANNFNMMQEIYLLYSSMDKKVLFAQLREMRTKSLGCCKFESRL